MSLNQISPKAAFFEKKGARRGLKSNSKAATSISFGRKTELSTSPLKSSFSLFRSPVKMGATPIFMPFQNERDRLGKLIPTTGSKQAKTIKKSSFFKNVDDQQLTGSFCSQADVDKLSAKKDNLILKNLSFEKQINIVLKNKELMRYFRFLQKDRPKKTFSFNSESREHQNRRVTKDKAPPLGTYNPRYSLVKEKSFDLFMRRKRTDREERKEIVQPFNDLNENFKRYYEKFPKFPDFNRMKGRSSTSQTKKNKQESIEIKLERRPNISMKKQQEGSGTEQFLNNTPSHNVERIPQPFSMNKVNEIRRDLMVKYDLRKFMKMHNLNEK